MTVMVETYEVDEARTEHPECTEEALSLMQSMGLDGQLKLVKPAEPGELAAKAFPYRKMREEERIVFGILCPAITPIKEFDGEQIPLRVLQVAAHAQTHFKHLLILHPQNAAKDPVLVGTDSDNPRYHPNTWFILARWGAELDEWPALLAKAARMYGETLKSSVAEKLTKLRTLEAVIANGVDGSFLLRHNGGTLSLYGPGL